MDFPQSILPRGWSAERWAGPLYSRAGINPFQYFSRDKTYDFLLSRQQGGQYFVTSYTGWFARIITVVETQVIVEMPADVVKRGFASSYVIDPLSPGPLCTATDDILSALFIPFQARITNAVFDISEIVYGTWMVYGGRQVFVQMQPDTLYYGHVGGNIGAGIMNWDYYEEKTGNHFYGFLSFENQQNMSRILFSSLSIFVDSFYPNSGSKNWNVPFDGWVLRRDTVSVEPPIQGFFLGVSS